MPNDSPAPTAPPPPRLSWRTAFDRSMSTVPAIGSALFWGPIAWALLLLWTTFGGPRAWLPFLAPGWFAYCLFWAPFIVWLASWADGMPASRSISGLAAGLAPGLFFLPVTALDRPPLVWATLPALIAWGAGANYFVFHPLPRRWRRALLGLAAAACLAAAARAVVLLALFRPSFRDTGFEQPLAWGLCALSAAALVLFAWQGLRLARSALRSAGGA